MTQNTQTNETNVLTVATRETMGMNTKSLVALASIAKRSLHQVTINTLTGKSVRVEDGQDELSDNTAKVWEVWGNGKQSLNGENATFYKAFPNNEGDDGLGAYLVNIVYTQLGVNAKRLADNITKSGYHTMKTSGEAAKVLQQIKDLGYYADRFNVNLDGSPIAPTAENAPAEKVAKKATK